ncbi:NUDIX hydrolase [Bradyrhizobium sp. LTSPM299]|uniref:NUDIX hydrolase n=1 Tax=Bradyrhizobium sp. LTSPM299 TaxID=1619233 RepID=UPI0007C64E79|nr:NUDIX hydrolase [Bradyrhizobium sp. LTSPM299]
MARTPVLAAGGIVLRRDAPPRFAVVRLRKRNEWVLPKGKLDDGETPRDAAEREVLEETGHDVDVHEFIGTLVYESGGRSKVVHYWRMDAGDRPVRELMNDIRAVDWLPLKDALDRLSRGYERAFLENVGPIALQAAARDESVRRARARAAAAEKRRGRGPVVPPAVGETPVVEEAPPVEEMPAALTEPDAPAMVPDDVVEAGEIIEAEQAIDAVAPAEPPSFAPAVEPVAIAPANAVRRNLIQRVRDWLGRAV